MAAPMKKCVDLGFVERTDELWRLESHYFPNKVGGKPAWLALSKLPSSEQLSCSNCGKPLIFLLQIYAPLTESSDNENTFHRTLLVFCCKSQNCGALNCFKVFRSQLPCVNPYYSEQPPPEEFDSALPCPRAADHQTICYVCGCPGSKHCGNCKTVNYCSREHQTADWKHGHKARCQNRAGCEMDKGSETEKDNLNPLLFPVLELVMEEEPEKKAEKSEEDTMAEYNEFMKSGKAESMVSGKAVTDLEKMASGDDTLDKRFKQFKKRTDREPEQVLRYDRFGEPLWVSDQNIPTETDVPKCQCGAIRKFEFQIMPQLLYHLKVTTVEDCMDWGTLVIYTCSKSCDPENLNYAEEFIWRQDFSQ